MNERAIDKRTVAINPYLELIAKVVKAYKRDGDIGNGQAFIRAIEAATKDVELTYSEQKGIDAEKAANYRKRMEAREKFQRR